MTRAEAIKILMGHSHTPQERAALEALIPELAESEDERMIKAILSAIRGGLDTEKFLEKHGTNYEEVEAYLEKQKEQIPYTDFVIKPHKGDDNNPYDMRVSEAQEYAIKRGFGIPFNDGEVYVDERHLTQTIGNILRWADEHPKEQKPVEIDEYKIIKKHITKDSLSGEVNKRLKECGWYFTDEKPAEWSKEDKENLDNIIWLCDNCEKGIEDTWIPAQAREIKKLIKSLRPVNQEWSEEDEHNLNSVISLVHSTSDGAWGSCIGDRIENWLKSLRPSWKPSKKQMDALAWYSGNSAIPPTGDKAIQSLYNDLKKLM